MKKIITTVCLLVTVSQLFAQQDTLFSKELSEVVVTATRTERKLGNVAVPVSIISQQTIRQAGSQRLNDILGEQAGIFITNGFGAGLQMQGFNPDYTLILVDGEPVVGRTAGVLDLNRISAGNIKKIEIVKGPSSSLYGSEAMAGVVNIITDKSAASKLEASLRYGFGNPDKGFVMPFSSSAFQNTEATLQAATTIHKLGIRFFSNANFADLISIRPYSNDRVPQPVTRLSNQLQLTYPLTIKTNLTVSARMSDDNLKQAFAVSNNGAITNSYGNEINRDASLNAVIAHKVNARISTSLRLYAIKYLGRQELHFVEKPDSVYLDEFRQRFFRAENQTDVNWKKSSLTFGAGYAIDEVNSTRYDDLKSRKQNNIFFGYAQQEWRPFSGLTVIAGLRYDNNKLFDGAISPKFAVNYKISPRFKINFSAGRGFKAPDFRQLFLNFTNTAAGGYSVFGTIDAQTIIAKLKTEGQISEVTDDYYKLSQLKPEFSTGVNLGGLYTPDDNTSIRLNFFRNDIENLIDSREVATRINGTQIFSYINVNKAWTEGGETEIAYRGFKNLQLSTGYQFLLTADKDERKAVREKTIYTRDENGFSRLLKLNEYSGLPNRSRHMSNLKITWDNKKTFFTTRFIYRSPWAVGDADGNGLYNKQDEFAKGFLQVNVSGGTMFTNMLRMQAGVDNLFNYQDISNLPNLQGRMIYIGFYYNFIKP